MAGTFTHNGNVVEGLPSIASQINYSNTSSGIQATQVQAAIDELNTNKQPKTDNNLTTTSKETTGAINELKSGLNNYRLSQETSSTGTYREKLNSLYNAVTALSLNDKISGCLYFSGLMTRYGDTVGNTKEYFGTTKDSNAIHMYYIGLDSQYSSIVDYAINENGVTVTNRNDTVDDTVFQLYVHV